MRVDFYSVHLSSLYNQPVAMDDDGVHVLDRCPREGRPGYDHFTRLVPFAEVDHLRIYRETTAKRWTNSLWNIALGLFLTGIMVAAFAAGIYIIGLITILGPLLVIAWVVELFTPLGMYLDVRLAGKVFAVRIDSGKWAEKGEEMIALVSRSGCPHDLELRPVLPRVSQTRSRYR